MFDRARDLSCGFLPATAPLKKLPAAFDVWEQTALHLPKLLLSNQLRHILAKMPVFPVAKLKSPAEIERAMLILSFLGHAYVWGTKPPADKIPTSLAKPWCEVANILQRPPVLSYASYALHNWYRIDPEGPIACGNIALLQNFLGGVDEEWFVLIHIDIEARIVPALSVLALAQQAAEENDLDTLAQHLTTIADALEAICDTLDRMPEKCDPYIYYNRVRPYIHGWKNNPALPNGLVYEGVDSTPQFFRGETGAQSTIIPSLDATLGITHENDELSIYLREMREYMPIEHRDFLGDLEKKGPIVRTCVQNQHEKYPALRELYNQCVSLMVRFRLTHLQYAATYIHQQSQQSSANSTIVGTGGTPFMKYLKKHEVESEKFKI
ncbi:MAG: hypothetical protein SFW66_09155 [Gammaproteobacteria bacterium]|nr:hypothetical protein [Gammaproteobacteria bacterium]